MEKKVIVLCLDGLSWNVIERMTDEGQLENIQEMMKEGSVGEMKPDPPLFSPKIWTSIFTGKKPEKHGIKDFFSLQKDLKTQQIWDILEEKGLSLGVYRPWSAWTAKEVDHFSVPGFFSFGEEAYPQKLNFIAELDRKARLEELSSTFLGKVFLKLIGVGFPAKQLLHIFTQSLSTFTKDSFKERLHLLKDIEFTIHSNLFFKLLEDNDPEFSLFYENSCDVLSHNYWEDMKTDSQFSEVIPEIYRKIDEFVGEVKKYSEREGCTLLIISDHGFEGTEPEKQVSLKTMKVLKELELDDEVYGMNMLGSAILRPKPGSSQTLKEIVEVFESISCEGKKVFEIRNMEDKLVVKIKDFVFENKNSDVKLPDGRIFSIDEIIDFETPKTGDHSSENGVFLIRGANIKQGKEIGELKPRDVTPTILLLLEVPIPLDLDGEVLEVFKQKPEIKFGEKSEKEEKKEELTSEEEEKVKEKLKDLGYL